LGFLDPISGDESFSEVKPLKIAAPPKFWFNAHMRPALENISRQFQNEAIARGAKTPPSLSIGAIT
jgi:hypothetical protein